MKELDLIILLNGGYAPVRIKESEKSDIYITLGQCIAGTYDQKVLVMGDVAVRPDAIIGFYFREVLQNPATKAVELMQKIVDGTDSGESWKNG